MLNIFVFENYVPAPRAPFGTDESGNLYNTSLDDSNKVIDASETIFPD